MKYLILLTALLLCAPAWGAFEGEEYCNQELKQFCGNDKNCPTDKDILHCIQHVRAMKMNGKRQEYLDKCDKYLEYAQKGDCYCEGEGFCHCPDQDTIKAQYAQIATAYCLRAQLEEK